MTTPGTVVAEQPAAAAKASLGRVREAGARGDGARAPGEGEPGFGEVLSKLKGQGGQYAGEAAVSNAGSASEERTGLRRRGIETQLAAAEDGGDLSLGATVDRVSGGDLAPVGNRPHAGAAPEAARTEAAPLPAPEPDIATATASATATMIAAMVAHNPGGQSAGREPDLPAATPTPAPTATPAAAARAMLEGAPPATDARPAPAIDPLAQQNAELRLAGAIDPSLNRFSARGMAKDRSEPADRDLNLASATELALSEGLDNPAATQGREPAAAKEPPKVSVLRQETHFAPVSPALAGPQAGISAEDNTARLGGGLDGGSAEVTAAAPAPAPALALPDEAASFAASPAQQIADGIVRETGAAVSLADRAGMTPNQPPGAKPALRIVHVQLQPADLGTVTVRMELKDAELTLQVESDRAETVDLIRSDQDTLARLLRSAGYTIDTNSIRVVEGDRTAASQQVGQQGTQTSLQSSPQSQSGGWERQEHAQRGGTNGGDARPQTSRNDNHETTTNRAGLGLYI